MGLQSRFCDPGVLNQPEISYKVMDVKKKSCRKIEVCGSGSWEFDSNGGPAIVFGSKNRVLFFKIFRGDFCKRIASEKLRLVDLRQITDK